MSLQSKAVIDCIQVKSDFMNIHILIYSNANSDIYSPTSLPPTAGQQTHRQSTYFAVRDFYCCDESFLSWNCVSSFMRALAWYMRQDALDVPSRGAAAWCRPAVNQILLTRHAAR